MLKRDFLNSEGRLIVILKVALNLGSSKPKKIMKINNPTYEIDKAFFTWKSPSCRSRLKLRSRQPHFISILIIIAPVESFHVAINQSRVRNRQNVVFALNQCSVEMQIPFFRY